MTPAYRYIQRAMEPQKSYLLPILISVAFAATSAATYWAVWLWDWFFVLSLEYLVLAFLVPGVLVPLTLIVQAVRGGRWAWWAVLIACLLSLVTSVIHFFFIAAAGIGV